ncbi:MAG: transcriptional regulator [Rhodospirillum sp.]|nr:transcriptional regulator [Rhodospirillum sp.]
MALPSTSALRALDAVARLGSVTRAAAELNITRSAISHQLRFLEQELGFALVERDGRGVALTPRGESYAREVRKALQTLSDARARSADAALSGRLVISCAPGFASFWLCAEIGEFQKAHRQARISIVTPKRIDDVSAAGVDIYIAFGQREWGGKWYELLANLHETPVCSPTLINASGGLAEPNDLAKVTLLHLGDHSDWTQWLSAAEADEVDPAQGIVFSDMHLVIAAALAGQGVAIGDPIIAGGALSAGRLVRPFALAVRADSSYYLVADRGRLKQPLVKAFRSWIKGRLAAAETAGA